MIYIIIAHLIAIILFALEKQYVAAFVALINIYTCCLLLKEQRKSK